MSNRIAPDNEAKAAALNIDRIKRDSKTERAQRERARRRLPRQRIGAANAPGE